MSEWTRPVKSGWGVWSARCYMAVAESYLSLYWPKAFHLLAYLVNSLLNTHSSDTLISSLTLQINCCRSLVFLRIFLNPNRQSKVLLQGCYKGYGSTLVLQHACSASWSNQDMILLQYEPKWTNGFMCLCNTYDTPRNKSWDQGLWLWVSAVVCLSELDALRVPY